MADTHLWDEFIDTVPANVISEVEEALRATLPPKWARRDEPSPERPRAISASNLRRNPSKKRYFTVEDYEGLTPSQLRRASKETQLRYMTNWFWTYYEDPSASTPHESSEGGFQYIWGGPYDASDELFNEFHGVITESRILEAVNVLQSDGIYDWAPSPEHPNRRADEIEFQAGDELSDETAEDQLVSITEMLSSGTQPNYGAADEIAQRQDILARLAYVEAELARLKRRRKPKPSAPRNHNNPPELLVDEEGDRIDDTEKAVAEIKGELANRAPDAAKVASATSRLFSFVKFCAKKIAEKAAEKIGEKIIDSSMFQSAFGLLKQHVFTAAENLVGWLMNVTLPF